MMKQSARWTLTVSSDLDRQVRRLLAATGRKGDLSQFVTEAVNSRLLELSVKTLRTSRVPANDVDPAPAPDADAESVECQYGR
jgi:hypothetical protein